MLNLNAKIRVQTDVEINFSLNLEF